jgi:hypothetical protein
LSRANVRFAVVGDAEGDRRASRGRRTEILAAANVIAAYIVSRRGTPGHQVQSLWPYNVIHPTS